MGVINWDYDAEIGIWQRTVLLAYDLRAMYIGADTYCVKVLLRGQVLIVANFGGGGGDSLVFACGWAEGYAEAHWRGCAP